MISLRIASSGSTRFRRSFLGLLTYAHYGTRAAEPTDGVLASYSSRVIVRFIGRDKWLSDLNSSFAGVPIPCSSSNKYKNYRCRTLCKFWLGARMFNVFHFASFFPRSFLSLPCLALVALDRRWIFGGLIGLVVGFDG